MEQITQKVLSGAQGMVLVVLSGLANNYFGYLSYRFCLDITFFFLLITYFGGNKRLSITSVLTLIHVLCLVDNYASSFSNFILKASLFLGLIMTIEFRERIKHWGNCSY